MAPDQPEVWAALANLPDVCFISPEWLAKQLHRGDEAIRRAIERGELPHPMPLCSRRYWLVGHLRDFFMRRARSLEGPPSSPVRGVGDGDATGDPEGASVRRYTSPIRKV
jgi:hypothetical protein